MNYYYHKMAEVHIKETHQSAANDRLVQECRKESRIAFGSYLQQLANHLHHAFAVNQPTADTIRITSELQRAEV